CYGRGRALEQLRRFDEAVTSFDKAIILKPDFPDARYGRAQCRLMLGDFAGGWQDNEYRWRSRLFAGGRYNPAFEASRTLQDLKGKTILVAAEQGAGDEIMFASIIPDLVREAKSV